MGVWSSPTVWVGLVVVTVASGVALTAGGTFERRTAPWIWVAWLMTPLLQALSGEYVPILLFTLIDATLLLVLGGLAMGEARRGPRGVVAVQGVVLGVDVVRLVSPIAPWTYLTVLAITAYLLLAALMFSTWESRQRLT